MDALKKAKSRLKRTPGVTSKIALVIHWLSKLVETLIYYRLLNEDRRIEDFYFKISHDRSYAEQFAEDNFFFIEEFLKANRVLDIGCGRGRIPTILATLGKTDAIALDLQRNKFWNREKASFLVSSVTDMPFISSLYDACTCLTVLEEVPSEKSALQEMYRVLKHGGILVMQTPNKHNPKGLLTRRRLYSKHVREYDQEEIVRLVEDAGFRIRKVGAIGFYLPFLTRFFSDLISYKTWLYLGRLLPERFRGVIWIVCEK